jgi:(p)ppGpp synthase/HD superfamily hydrolase
MLYMPATLEDALEYAIKAHKGQKDKSNLPYILHPLSVMLRMNTDEERILALCHDIAEDTSKSPHDVAYDLGMGAEWETWLTALTHKKSVPYLDYITQIKPYPIAVKVKLADLEHNLSRLKNLPDNDQARLLKKYKGGIEALSK